ncbi:hypothetical protein JTE90_004447 [Oedothorax gibbosus]|uniref:Hormone-sensitive lipase n=1 Tax=Oedothorax gibbosus TaxID=931172 RepID=A0AAV6UP36_9ARAC|nr:hypothetical protein JTE90_004447 [Oedothorax gibbosus]
MRKPELLSIDCDFEVIYLAVVNNIDFFFFIREKYWYADKFVASLRELLSHLHWYEEKLVELYEEAHRFDFYEVQGNGFRSFCLIFERCFSDVYKFCKNLSSARNSLFFRPGHYLKETESLVKVLSGLRPGLNFLAKMLSMNVDNQLIMPDKTFTAEELIIECGSISQLGFYGRYQGFYYCTSMQRILQGVGVIVATFSDLYQSSGGPVSKAALTIMNGLKYIFNPELRSEQIVHVAQNSSVEFLKAFWSLSETQFMKQLPGWVCPKLKIREDVFIPCEPITLKSILTKENVLIPAPSSHIPPAPVRCLLLSRVHRMGQTLKNGKTDASHLKPKSRSLLFHCHGGGFISQNPESHEIYLRHWAHDLDVPIISVDYSLSPLAPFPRALEEVLLTYAWILNNPEKLGWTGEIICVAGDSAGGNILMGIVLKAIALNIRLPDAVMCAYTPLILDIVPSPSRLLCWIDPLLPLGFMISCLDSYAGAMQTDSDEYDDNPDYGSSGQKSRKVSSITQIFDSSINFLKQYQWTEVEGNEAEDTIDSAFYGSQKCLALDSNNYVHSFLNEYNKEIEASYTIENINCNKEHTIFSFPHDILYDVKEKCQKIANFGLAKISETFITSSFYQKVLSPFVPDIGLPQTEKKQLTCPSKSTILQKIKKLKIVSKNPLMSPLLASDDVLKQMPPVYFVSLNFDPCLDDSIAFAKRLRSLNRHVILDVLDGLPHGFLNFLPFSQEAHNGSNHCVRRLKEVMKL